MIFNNNKKLKYSLEVAAEPPNTLVVDVVFAFTPNGDDAPKPVWRGAEAPPKIDGAVLVALPPNI